MPGILDVLRAAAMPAAAARSGFLHGEMVRDDRNRARAAEERAREDQRRREQKEEARWSFNAARDVGKEQEDRKRQGVLDQARAALLAAQTAETRARADRNTAQAGNYRGSGPNGRLTERDKQRFIGARLRHYMVPRYDDIGEQIPGSGLPREEALMEAERDWRASVGSQPEPPAPPVGDGSAVGRDRGGFVSPARAKGAVALPGAAPAATPASTAPRSRGAITEARAAAAPTPPALDSAALAKKYPWLFDDE